MRTNRGKENSYNPRPVIRAELSKKNLVLRVILLVVFLITGFVFLGIGINRCLTVDPGMTEITAYKTQLSCAPDFHFYYDIGKSGNDTTVENKLLYTTYGDLTLKAYHIFDERSTSKEFVNLNYLNSHPNTDIKIDENLYKALKKLAETQEKYLYLAPVYEDYEALVQCNYDQEASNYDPLVSSDQKDFIDKINTFINDENHIKLIFKEDNVVYLRLSIEYITYLNSNSKSCYVSLNVFKNAFILDYFYDNLLDRDFPNGFIYSIDGYYRSLGLEYNKYIIYDKVDNDLLQAAKLDMPKPMTLVNYRNFEIEDNYCYKYENGRMVTLLTDLNGYNKQAISYLATYSENISCSSLALLTASVYSKESLNLSDLNALKEKNIYSIYLKDKVIYTNDSNVNLVDILNIEDATYSWKKNDED